MNSWGIGQEALRAQYLAVSDTVKGDDAIAMAKRAAREEGLFVGISAGCNIAKAIEIAAAHPGSKVVAIIPDGGDKYVSMGIYE